MRKEEFFDVAVGTFATIIAIMLLYLCGLLLTMATFRALEKCEARCSRLSKITPRYSSTPIEYFHGNVPVPGVGEAFEMKMRRVDNKLLRKSSEL
jgi:hypothetical protein